MPPILTTNSITGQPQQLSPMQSQQQQQITPTTTIPNPVPAPAPVIPSLMSAAFPGPGQDVDLRPMDPRAMDLRNVDPRNVDPRTSDIRSVDPRLADPRLMRNVDQDLRTGPNPVPAPIGSHY